MKKPGNFTENIHDEDYEEEYYSLPLNESTFVYDSGRDKELLNGDWSFQADQYDTCLRSRWYREAYKDGTGRDLPVDFDFDGWDTIRVPSSFNVQQDRLFFYEGPVVYTRKFNYVNRGEKRVFIKFGAVNYDAKVFLNKKYIGCHKGGSTPFFAEVTDYLYGSNRLLVVADNTRKRTNVPCKNTDWFNYGGIYRDVELIRLPETFIKEFSINLVPGSDFKKIRAKAAIEGKANCGQAILEIPELGVREKIDIAEGRGEIVFNAMPELWSPENPKLYDVKLSYLEDMAADKIGFREIAVKGQDIYLNGKKIFLKGVCTHEESIINGKSMSEYEIRENFSIAKEMNCNFMRLAHYPHTEKAAEIADEMGLLLWEEIPVYWAIDFKNTETYIDARNQLTELIKRDMNRASVIIWSVGNENQDTDERLKFMSSLADRAKEIDPTRPVSAACLVDNANLMIKDRLEEYLDIIGINEYYGWYDPDFSKLGKILENSSPQKPVIISEFGADAKAGARGTADDLGTEDCQLNIYKMQVSTLEKIPYIKGICPWILYDFRCPRRTNILQGLYNRKGLLSADKKYRKPAFYVMQEYYRRKQL